MAAISLLAAFALCSCARAGQPRTVRPSSAGVVAAEGAAANPPFWKGVAYPLPPADEALRYGVLADLGVSWWLSGGYEDSFLQDARFVPMIPTMRDGAYGGGVCTTLPCLGNYARSFPGRTWLLLDEPERAEGANMPPVEAAAQVDAIVAAMRQVDPMARFACCGTWTDEAGTEWMRDFLGHVKALDVIHVHASYPGSAEGRAASLERFYAEMQFNAKAAGLPLWITEIGYCCSQGSSEWVRDWLMAPFFEWYRCGGGATMYERVAWYAARPEDDGWLPSRLYDDNLQAQPLADFYRLLGDVSPPVPELPQTPPGTRMTLQPVADTYLNAWYATRNYGAESEIVLRLTDVKAGLMRFDVSALPEPGAIAKARLLLFASTPGPNPISISVQEVLRPWSEAEATWNMASNGVPWEVVGCNGIGVDRAAGEAGSLVAAPGEYAWYEIDLTTLVRKWAGDPGANFGLALKADGDAVSEFGFTSREYPDACWQPRLEVWYESVPQPTFTQAPSPTRTPTATLPPTDTPIVIGTLQPKGTPTSLPTATATFASVEDALQNLEGRVRPLETRVAAMEQVLSALGGVKPLGPGDSPTVPRRLVAYAVDHAPTIDGDLSEWASDGRLTVNKLTADYLWGDLTTSNDPRAYVLARWDPEYLYLAFQVRDQNVVMDSGIKLWEDDGIEIGLDGEYDRRYTPYASHRDDYALSIRPDGQVTDYDGAPPPLLKAISFSLDGYDIELAIPMATLTTRRIENGSTMGITFGLRDDDDGGDLESYLIWEGNDPYFGQAYFGELLFSSQVLGILSAEAQATANPRALTGSVVLQQGMDGYVGASDTYIVDGDCSNISLYGDSYLGLGLGPNARALLRFDLAGALPDGAVVTQAILSIWAYSGGSGAVQVNAFQVGRAWDARFVTWTSTAQSEKWSQPGCGAIPVDHASLVAATTTLSSLNLWYSLDITTMCKAWATDPSVNHGVILVPADGAGGFYRFYSSESSNMGWRPKLAINYRVP